MALVNTSKDEVNLYNSTGGNAHTIFFVDAQTRTMIQGKKTGGYRMARATVGVVPHTASASASASASTATTTSSPNVGYYWEARVLPGPTCAEILQALPPQARLGKQLQKQLEQGVMEEERQMQESEAQKQSKKDVFKSRKSTTDDTIVPRRVGGQVRVGWSLRTAEAHAPVGYDTRSYGIRSLDGARIHASHRWLEDSTNAAVEEMEFAPGDVIGCAIMLDPADSIMTASLSGAINFTSNPLASVSMALQVSPSSTASHIRFFHNGRNILPMEIRKGKRSGGEAFLIEPGTYYPAVSTYLGGGVQANFGPHFLYPPKPLPIGLKLQPLSSRCPVPMTPEQALSHMMGVLQNLTWPNLTMAGSPAKTVSWNIKDWHQAWRTAIQAEATIWRQAYDAYALQQLQDLHAARQARHMSVADLPALSSGGEDESKREKGPKKLVKQDSGISQSEHGDEDSGGGDGQDGHDGHDGHDDQHQSEQQQQQLVDHDAHADAESYSDA
jgi:SPRY domain